MDQESFSSAHVVLSALYRGAGSFQRLAAGDFAIDMGDCSAGTEDEAGFGRLLRRIWRLPQVRCLAEGFPSSTDSAQISRS